MAELFKGMSCAPTLKKGLGLFSQRREQSEILYKARGRLCPAPLPGWRHGGCKLDTNGTY